MQLFQVLGTSTPVSRQRGFTLVELLVVMFIIGMLATIVTVSSTASRAQARDAQRKADLQTVASALELYRATNKRYPDIQVAGESWNQLKAVLHPTYISRWPVDPKSGGESGYTYASNLPSLGPIGTMYMVEAKLENEAEAVTAPEIVESNNGSSQFFITGVYRSSAGQAVYRVAGR